MTLVPRATDVPRRPPMSLVRVTNFSISLDGFGAGEPQSLEAPFGHAGQKLHEWMFATAGGTRRASNGVDLAFAQRVRRRLRRRDHGRQQVRPARLAGRPRLARLVGRGPALPHADVRPHAPPAAAAGDGGRHHLPLPRRLARRGAGRRPGGGRRPRRPHRRRREHGPRLRRRGPRRPAPPRPSCPSCSAAAPASGTASRRSRRRTPSRPSRRRAGSPTCQLTRRSAAGCRPAGPGRFRAALTAPVCSPALPSRSSRPGGGVWRSLVARVVRDDEAAGSNPVTPTIG